MNENENENQTHGGSHDRYHLHMCSLVPRLSMIEEWAPIVLNFDLIWEIRSKVVGGHSFEGGCSFPRLWYCAARGVT